MILQVYISLCFSALAVVPSIFAASISVVVNGTASHSIPDTLYGWMWEDINSGDGGLYAEMLQNRAFQQVTAGTSDALQAWTAVNGATIEVVNDTAPLSAALPNALKVTIPSKAKGSVGVANAGYYGINVNHSWTYDASFYYKFPTGSKFKGKFIVSLISLEGQTIASSSVSVTGTTTKWTQSSVHLKPTTSASNTNNTFTVTLDPTNGSAGGETVFFSLFSLFPPTFKNRPNGMRIDLAEAIAATGPAFFRFPGGNNLGQTVATRWQWNDTVGPLTERPGRVGDWGYVNTDGIGLKEYLDFIEDAGMQPILAVWSGYALGGEIVPEADLAPYIQQAIDQINFVIGDPATTEPGALRASLGHPEPYELHYVEIGNEDFFASDTYGAYRWHDFVTNLTATFPQLNFLATTYVFNPVLDPTPGFYDVHVYQTPSWFAENVFSYDGFERNGTKYFEGEYAAISLNENNLYGTPDEGRLLFPTMQASSGEAAFMTGLERNADIVFAASYAPSFQNMGNFQWTPNLVSYTANEVFLSTSYYVQKMFSLSKGTEYLPSTLPNPDGTVFWSVTRDTNTSEVFIKVANTNATEATVEFTLPFKSIASMGTVELLSGAPTDSNTPDAPDTAVPELKSFSAKKSFEYTAPGYSVSVLKVTAH